MFRLLLLGITGLVGWSQRERIKLALARWREPARYTGLLVEPPTSAILSVAQALKAPADTIAMVHGIYLGTEGSPGVPGGSFLSRGIGMTPATKPKSKLPAWGVASDGSDRVGVWVVGSLPLKGSGSPIRLLATLRGSGASRYLQVMEQ